MRLTIPALAFAAALSAGIAHAQTPAPIQPKEPSVSMDDARRIASGHGMVRIEEAELQNGIWELEGRDGTGAEIKLNVSAQDGKVIKMERDRPASASARP